MSTNDPQVSTVIPTERILAMDALRGAAVLAILAAALLQLPQPIAMVGIHLLVMVSGFCVHLRMARRAKGQRLPQSFAVFSARRFVRVYPVYLAALALCIGAMLIMGAARQGLSIGATWHAIRVDVLVHLTMLQSLIMPKSSIVGFSALWAMALAVQLYVLYKPMLRLRYRFGLRRTVIFIGFVTLLWRGLSILLFQSTPWTALPTDTSIAWLLQGPAFWFTWALGAAAAEGYTGRNILPKWSNDLRVAGAALGLAALSMIHPLGWWIGDMLWGVGFFVMTNAILSDRPAESGLDRWWHGLAKVGLVSYSLFVTHDLVIDTFAAATGNFATTAPGIIVTGALCAAVGYLFWRVIERPVINRMNTAAWLGNTADANRHAMRISIRRLHEPDVIASLDASTQPNAKRAA